MSINNPVPQLIRNFPQTEVNALVADLETLGCECSLSPCALRVRDTLDQVYEITWTPTEQAPSVPPPRDSMIGSVIPPQPVEDDGADDLE